MSLELPDLSLGFDTIMHTAAIQPQSHNRGKQCGTKEGTMWFVRAHADKKKQKEKHILSYIHHPAYLVSWSLFSYGIKSHGDQNIPQVNKWWSQTQKLQLFH